MPESYGKRQRGVVKAKKAEKREERRKARRERRNDPETESAVDIQEPAPPDDVSEAQ